MPSVTLKWIAAPVQVLDGSDKVLEVVASRSMPFLAKHRGCRSKVLVLLGYARRKPQKVSITHITRISSPPSDKPNLD
jgi:hypothetical protein